MISSGQGVELSARDASPRTPLTPGGFPLDERAALLDHLRSAVGWTYYLGDLVEVRARRPRSLGHKQRLTELNRTHPDLEALAEALSSGVRPRSTGCSPIEFEVDKTFSVLGLFDGSFYFFFSSEDTKVEVNATASFLGLALKFSGSVAASPPSFKVAASVSLTQINVFFLGSLSASLGFDLGLEVRPVARMIVDSRPDRHLMHRHLCS